MEMEVEKINISAEAHPMTGGDGLYSYTKNSDYQRSVIHASREMICEEISKKLDIKPISSTSYPFRIADLGCSVGPNTFFAVQNIIAAVENKLQIEGLSSSGIPEFHVFFNDHVSNDFNTLFASLPAGRLYFTAGVPGSFYGRLFPAASLDFVHSSYALQWLSMVPKEVTDKNSPAYNKGKIYYASASEEVIQAYSTQFSKDIGTFLSARAKEIVCGGMMVLIMPAIPNGTPVSESTGGILYDLLGSCFMDMAKMGLTDEAKVDSFNLPMYLVSPREIEDLVERNGYFSIERLEQITNLTTPDVQTGTMHLRAAMQGIIGKHFGSEIIDQLFDRFSEKLADQSSYIFNARHERVTQLLVVLKRKLTD
uniref:S-adenosylmethionine-dependent methyltransferase At5g38100 n=1 Tax=Nelumbo nucifera TaxID=4432 RepID=A0A822YWA7_NELNU|nr:TPA_asm: hypothetical protein HUJ06_006441 [Nelumbo nucifera]